MIDATLTQLLLFIALIILIITLTAIGWQIFLILSEIRKLFEKINKAMTNAGTFASTVGKSFASITGFADGLRSVIGFVTKVKKPNAD